MILSLLVYARANRMALIVASVPELTILTISIEGISSVINLANFISISVGAPKLGPFSTSSFTAFIIFLGV